MRDCSASFDKQIKINAKLHRASKKNIEWKKKESMKHDQSMKSGSSRHEKSHNH
jgi:hypothetical protein